MIFHQYDTVAQGRDRRGRRPGAFESVLDPTPLPSEVGTSRSLATRTPFEISWNMGDTQHRILGERLQLLQPIRRWSRSWRLDWTRRNLVQKKEESGWSSIMADMELWSSPTTTWQGHVLPAQQRRRHHISFRSTLCSNDSDANRTSQQGQVHSQQSTARRSAPTLPSYYSSYTNHIILKFLESFAQQTRSFWSYSHHIKQLPKLTFM